MDTTKCLTTQYNKYDFFLYIITDEEEQQLQPVTLTRQHKGAIRAIRKVIYP